MRTRSDRSSRLALVQVALMGAVVAAFLVDTVVELRAGDDVAQKVGDMAGNAMPSVVLLARARGELHRMQRFVRQSVRAAEGMGPKPPEVLGGLRQDFQASLTSYLALPCFPGERDLYGEVSDAKAGFDRTVAETLAAVDRRDVVAARASVQMGQVAMDRLDEAIERVEDFAAARGQRLGLRSAQVHHDVTVHTLAVGFGLAVLAMAATVLAAIAWRRSVAELQERTSELDMFAGRVAHDLMSPLMSVGLGLSLSKQRLGDDPVAVATVERAARSLGRARTLVDGLLEFARAGASAAGGEAAVCGEIRGVLDGLQDEAAEAGVELRLEASRECRVACPPGVLASLTQNIVRNAIKYMGGSERRQVTARARDAGALVHVAVEDTGPGVPEDVRARIFEPFVRGTQDVPGTGLGLATVKKLAEAYGGRVGCRSTPGVGSVFWFELPRARARSASDGKQAPASAPR